MRGAQCPPIRVGADHRQVGHAIARLEAGNSIANLIDLAHDAVAHHHAPARDLRLLTIELDLSLLLVDPVLQLAVRRPPGLEADHDQPFAVDTLGGLVEATILDGGRAVRVDMGTARFGSDVIPVAGPRRDVIGEAITAGDRELRFSAVTVGNPHCVLPLDDVDPELARRYGPTIEVDPATFAVRIDGELVTPDPVAVLPLAQRYSLF